MMEVGGLFFDFDGNAPRRYRGARVGSVFDR